MTAILARDRAGLPEARAWRVLGMLLAFAAIAPWHSGNPRLVLYALAGMLASALVLAAAGWTLVRVLGGLRNQTRMSWRFGLASVARRARLSVLQTTAIGLGLAVILLLGLVRNDLFRQWTAHLPPDAPNQFLINIQSDEVDALRDFLHAHAKLTAHFYPMVRGRLTAINGAPVILDNYTDQRARRLADREFNLSSADSLKPDNRIVAGRWWTAQARSELSVEQGIADTLGLKLGDDLSFLVADREVHGRITSLRKVDWENFQVNFFVVTTPDMLAAAPATYITSFRLDGAEPGAHGRTCGSLSKRDRDRHRRLDAPGAAGHGSRRAGFDLGVCVRLGGWRPGARRGRAGESEGTAERHCPAAHARRLATFRTQRGAE